MSDRALAASLENIFAPLLLGTWFNSMMFMLELLLAYQYFSHKNLRSPGANSAVVRGIVVLQLLNDTVGTMGNAAYTYLFLVTHWGDPAFLMWNPWPGTIYALTSGISGFIVQLYLTWRYGILSKNYFVCVLLVLSTMTAFAGALGTMAMSIIHKSVAERSTIVPMSMVWLISAAVTDIAIAVALVLQLRSYQSSFKRTQSIIRRLSVGAIQTGSATAIVAAIMLVLFVVWPRTTISLTPGFFLGRLYGCTLLFNLTTRRMGSTGDSTDPDDHMSFSGSRAPGHGTSGGARDRERGGTRLDTFGGIHVQVQVDKDNDGRVRDRDAKRGTDDLDTADDASISEHKSHMPGVI